MERNQFFIHRRIYDKDGKPSLYGGETVCYEMYGDSIKFSVCKCSKKDRYNRSIGRKISQGRLNSGIFIGFFYLDEFAHPHIQARNLITAFLDEIK